MNIRDLKLFNFFFKYNIKTYVGQRVILKVSLYAVQILNIQHGYPCLQSTHATGGQILHILWQQCLM